MIGPQMSLQMIVGKNIKSIRRSKGIRQIAFGKMLKVTQGQLSKIEQGQHGPDLESLRILGLFNFTISQLTMDPKRFIQYLKERR